MPLDIWIQKYKTLSDIWQPEKLNKSLKLTHITYYIKDTNII